MWQSYYSGNCIATYETTNCSVPLLFVAVKRNMKHMVVGLFSIQEETIEAIKEVMDILRLWNEPWNPVCFMVDNCIKEIHCLMIMMMNFFCGMVDRRKAFSLISSRDHCQRSSPSRISDTPWAGFEPAQNLISGLFDWSYAVVITTTPWHHCTNIPLHHGALNTFSQVIIYL